MSSFSRASASLLVALTLFGAPSAAWAGSGNAPSASDLQDQAQEISSQIQADARQLDMLDNQYNEAQIRYQQLSGQEEQLSVEMAATDRAVSQAQRVLKAEAVLAYVAGGSSFDSYTPSQPNTDPTLRAAYAEVVVGGEKQSITGYQANLAQQAHEASQLGAARHQAAIAMADVQSDQAAAQATLSAQRQALAQVKGQLATLVAQAEAARQRVEQAAVKANLAAQGQLPAPSAVPTTIAPPVSAAPPAISRATTPTSSPARASTTTTTTRPAPPKTYPSAPPAGDSPAPGAALAISYARAQLGKPYQWAGAGPDSFDCSGLTMMAWEQAGVYFPHLAQAQYDMTSRVSIAELLPGDLVFYGTPSNVYHVGLYIGSGEMIDAPATGQNVSIQTIYWDGLLGGGRVSS
jgi:cell wall-associated NlpC family hydrolase